MATKLGALTQQLENGPCLADIDYQRQYLAVCLVGMDGAGLPATGHHQCRATTTSPTSLALLGDDLSPIWYCSGTLIVS
jgi:hypothetical protein